MSFLIIKFQLNEPQKMPPAFRYKNGKLRRLEISGSFFFC